MIPIVIIEGATAAGKSNLAIKLALEMDTQIISADSRQVYRWLNIGTAKPSAAEQEEVKHHLIDVIDPCQNFDAGAFVAEADRIISDLNQQSKIPIVCGGTGLYVKTLLEGLFACPPIPNQIKTLMHERFNSEDLTALYHELVDIDPVFADKISAQDAQRIRRGLEVYMATGKAITEHWREQRQKQQYLPYRILVYRDRAELYQRIEARLHLMLESGLLDEIRALLETGYKEDCAGLKTMGYKEFIPYLKGEQSLEQCYALAAQHTRNYAKRQETWYRKYDFHLTLAAEEISISIVRESIQEFLKSGFPCFSQ